MAAGAGSEGGSLVPKPHMLDPSQAFQVVREVTSDLLRAQHENRQLILENERLRLMLHRAPITSDSELLPVFKRMQRSCGTQSEPSSLPPNELIGLYRAAQECQRGLDSLREEVIDHLKRLSSVENEVVSLAACNAQQHQQIQELLRVCNEHASLVKALQIEYHGLVTGRRA